MKRPRCYVDGTKLTGRLPYRPVQEIVARALDRLDDPCMKTSAQPGVPRIKHSRTQLQTVLLLTVSTHGVGLQLNLFDRKAHSNMAKVLITVLGTLLLSSSVLARDMLSPGAQGESTL